MKRHKIALIQRVPREAQNDDTVMELARGLVQEHAEVMAAEIGGYIATPAEQVPRLLPADVGGEWVDTMWVAVALVPDDFEPPGE